MKPIKTVDSGHTYVFPAAAGGNDHLPVERLEQVNGTLVLPLMVSVWQPTPEERQMIAIGGNIELRLGTNAPPPMAMRVTSLQEVAELENP